MFAVPGVGVGVGVGKRNLKEELGVLIQMQGGLGKLSRAEVYSWASFPLGPGMKMIKEVGYLGKGRRG